MPTLAVWLSDEVIAILLAVAKEEENARSKSGSSGRPVTAAAIGARLIRERLKQTEATERKK